MNKPLVSPIQSGGSNRSEGAKAFSIAPRRAAAHVPIGSWSGGDCTPSQSTNVNLAPVLSSENHLYRIQSRNEPF